MSSKLKPTLNLLIRSYRRTSWWWCPLSQSLTRSTISVKISLLHSRRGSVCTSFKSSIKYSRISLQNKYSCPRSMSYKLGMRFMPYRKKEKGPGNSWVLQDQASLELRFVWREQMAQWPCLITSIVRAWTQRISVASRESREVALVKSKLQTRLRSSRHLSTRLLFKTQTESF